MTTPNHAGEGVHDLVAQREQLRAWIAKLDEVQTGAPSRVAERVRADYQDRLRRVTEELASHAEEVQRSLEEMRGELQQAEERRAQAVDALEETRLRHLIGELDEPAWDQQRAPLEQDVSAADENVARTRGEVERLSVLSAEIGGGASAEAAEAVEPEPEPADDFAADEEEAEPLPVFAYAPEDEDTGGEPAPPAAEEEAPAFGDEPQAAAASPPEEQDAGPISGEELAAWISEVEAEVPSEEMPPEDATAEAPPAAPRQEAEGWDPFANEFGGSPANPTTQPGDAAQDLPWLDSIDGGAAGKWAAPAEEAPADDLAFLDQLEPAAPAAEEPAGSDLAADDLAFLEELDRAISGGSQRPAQQAQPQAGGRAEPTSFGQDLTGGSGGGISPDASAETTQEQRKRGEALLCKECGAINEPQAWYCEICGSEL
ncbi:MAG TPA: hypothetical protein VF092_30730 [Longimicrobium sp.]